MLCCARSGVRCGCLARHLGARILKQPDQAATDLHQSRGGLPMAALPETKTDSRLLWKCPIEMQSRHEKTLQERQALLQENCTQNFGNLLGYLLHSSGD